jgi:hypothetical protein
VSLAEFSAICNIVRTTNLHKRNHPVRKPKGRCDALAAEADKFAHSSRRKTLELIVVSMKLNKGDNYVGFYVLYILWVGGTVHIAVYRSLCTSTQLKDGIFCRNRHHHAGFEKTESFQKTASSLGKTEFFPELFIT